ncbi:Dclk3, partial [Symbiodinium natans]
MIFAWQSVIIMEACDKELFAALPCRTALAEFRPAQITSDIMRGLSYLHALKILHRDLNPWNILLKNVEGGVVAKISDLGMAVQCQTQLFGREGIDESSFTSVFSSPEFGTSRGYGFPADIFSAGMTLITIWCIAQDQDEIIEAVE